MTTLQPVPTASQSSRDNAVDVFRGLALLLMFCANYMEHIRTVPAYLKHAPDIGLTVIDFIAPLFMFAIGLTFRPSIVRRLERTGSQRTVEHIIARGFALIGIGMLFSIGEMSFGFSNSTVPWGVLQAIGTATLLAFPLLFLPAPVRLGAGIALLIAYQFALDAFWLKTVLAASHAGLPGVFSWTALLIIATVFADLYHEAQHRQYFIIAACMLAAGIGMSFFFPVSKHRMSLSFVLITVSSSALLFFTVKLILGRIGDIAFLRVLGMNSLLLYCAHLVLLSVFLVPSWPRWHTGAPLWQAAIQGVIFILALYSGAHALYRRNIFIKL